MRNPPSLLSLTVDSALLNLSNISDISYLPDHILIDLFLKTLKAGKLNERVLKLFTSTDNEELLALVRALNIRRSLSPVLPTNFSKDMAEYSTTAAKVNDDEIDIVIAAFRPDLTSFLNEWRPVFSRFHLIIVKDPDLKEDLKIPEGFNLEVFTKTDIDRLVGSSSILFSGYSCRYFGFLVSRKKYIVTIDDDCVPAKDPNSGVIVDIVAQHATNLATPATPFFFNTLYDPYRAGSDFVRGYPFSLRTGVSCAVSSGLWLNLADLDAPTQALRPDRRNSRYVDAVLTVPARALMPMSGINLAFDRELVGPALFPALRLAGEGKFRWETVEDVWSGLCVKVICDHLGLGVKTGLPYVWRAERGDAVESLRKEWEGVKLMEEAVPFFQSLILKRTTVKVEDCVVEIAKEVKERLGKVDPVFGRAAEAMVDWVRLWRAVGSASTS